jgi:hypothetical protein
MPQAYIMPRADQLYGHRWNSDRAELLPALTRETGFRIGFN